MKNLYFLCVFIIFLSGCQVLSFDRYPGDAQSEFPEKLRGKYINTSIDKTDTITLLITKNQFIAYDKKDQHGGKLNEGRVYSTFKGHNYYFYKEDDYWMGFEFEKKRKKIYITPIGIPHTVDSSSAMLLLNNYFVGVKKLNAGSGIEGNYYARMDELALIKYSKKLKNHNIKFIQVKTNE